MTNDQKTVALGAASGVLGMVVLVYALYTFLPIVPGMDDAVSRIIFTLRLNVLALLPLFVLLITVGNGRFLSQAIDPTLHKESAALEVTGRVADNTLQQNLVFLVGTLSLATFLSAETTQLLVALTIVFVLARLVFWVGYRINPLYRAPGMAATAYMNLGILATTLWLFLT